MEALLCLASLYSKRCRAFVCLNRCIVQQSDVVIRDCCYYGALHMVIASRLTLRIEMYLRRCRVYYLIEVVVCICRLLDASIFSRSAAIGNPFGFSFVCLRKSNWIVGVHLLGNEDPDRVASVIELVAFGRDWIHTNPYV